MKVLFVSSGNRSGGRPTNLIIAQGESLIANGVELEYYTINSKGLLGYLRSIYKIRDQLLNKKFDIIHAHYIFSGIISHFAKTKRQKLVVSIMGSDLIGDNSVSFATELFNKSIHFVTKIYAKFIFDFTIVKSKEMKRKLINNTKHIVLPNGVNFDKFKPKGKIEARTNLGIPLNKKIILFAADRGRLEKNFKLADESVKLLSDENVELISISNVTQDILNDYYNATDVVLMTSLYEGSPNVIKEALACNKVIVSTDVGDVKEHFSNIYGCFLTSFDKLDVKNNLEKALKIESTNSRDSISYLDSKLVAEKIIAIYSNLIKI